MGELIRLNTKRTGPYFELSSTANRVHIVVVWPDGTETRGWMTPEEALETSALYEEAAADAVALELDK